MTDKKEEPRDTPAPEETKSAALADVVPAPAAGEQAVEKSDDPKGVGALTDGVQSLAVAEADQHPFYSNKSWQEIGVPQTIAKLATSNLLWEAPSKIQAAFLPDLLAGKDAIFQAPGGSGKTGSYMITMLAAVERHGAQNGPVGLILTPTKELVEQVHKTVGAFDMPGVTACRCKVPPNDLGAGPVRDQIVVATLDTLKEQMHKKISLNNLKVLVVDEVDHYLKTKRDQEDFIGLVNTIRQASRDCQLTFFSATFTPDTIRCLKSVTGPDTRVHLVDEVQELLADLPHVTQYSVEVRNDQDKYRALQYLYDNVTFEQALVFVRSKRLADDVCAHVKSEFGYSVEVFHAGVEDHAHGGRSRKQILDDFTAGKFKVLVATDVLQRGLDIRSLDLVVNWELPRVYDEARRAFTKVDENAYVQRVLRGGRFGKQTKAFSFLGTDDRRDMPALKAHFKMEVTDVPLEERAFDQFKLRDK